MALQTKDFSTTKASYSDGVAYTYIVRVTENSVNEDNNTSNVTVQTILKSSYADPFYLMTMTVTCTLNGNQIINDTQQRTCNGTGENVFCTWTGDVEHNADGSLLLTVGSQLTHTFGDTYTFMPQSPMTISESNDNAMVLTPISRGLVYIHNGSNWDTYQCYIYNGSDWDLYIPFVHNGSSWDLYT